MSHIAYQPRGPSVELDVDYVVVGSGAGGATAAVTLARGGRTVCVVEAGAWRNPEDYPSTTYGALRDLFDDWGGQVTFGRALWPVVQARTVGGTTVINSAICVRTPGDIFREWSMHHGLDGGILETAVGRWQDQIESELCVEEVPPPAQGRSTRLALVGAERAGYHSHVMQRYVKGCAGSGQCLQGCRNLRKQSMNVNYIPEVIRRGGFVMSSAPVKKVLFEGQTAVGVTGRFVHPKTKKRGAVFTVRAKRAVVVAASATHSPALLLRSGVKNKALGKFFRAHPGTGVFGVYDDPVDMHLGATQAWASMAFRQNPGFKLETLSIPPEMVASRLPGGGSALMGYVKQMRHLAMWIHAIRASSVGFVRNGLGDKPIVRYSLGQRDMMRVRHGIHTVARTHVAAGAKAILPGIQGLPSTLSPNDIDVILDAPLDPRRYVAILSHLFGGCVMGADPKSAVTDARGQVHGYAHLAVADASVLPTNLGVNPQHTIMGMAGVIAEALLDQQIYRKPRWVGRTWERRATSA